MSAAEKSLFSDLLRQSDSGANETTLFSHAAFEILNGRSSGNLSPYMYASPLGANDAVNGEELFNRLCNHPAYYLRNAEAELIQTCRHAFADLVGEKVTLIDLGTGPLESVQKKPLPLLQALVNPTAYVGVDYCRHYVDEAVAAVANQFPGLPVLSLNTDFTQATDLAQNFHNPVFLLLGNVVGNFPYSPIYPNPDAVAFLQKIKNAMGHRGLLVVGQDCNQILSTLLAAYQNEAAANWMLNLLHRLRRDARVQLNVEAFDYYAEWNERNYCMEMGVSSRVNQLITMWGRSFPLKAGQKLHMWNSYKYSSLLFQELGQQAGFEPVAVFANKQRTSAIHIFRP
ncbi:MAG: L-histidine N(alpha)-methyltransferase [Dongiaceae bacterium]